MNKIKVLIVDDSASVRQVMSEVLSADPAIEIIGTAPDPYVAARKIAAMTPDVITLDVEMPRMDGLTFLRKIMEQHPIPVVICSSLTEQGSQIMLDALDAGAVDVISKPHMGTSQFLRDSHLRIRDAVRAAAAANLTSLGTGKSAAASARNQAANHKTRPAALRRTTDKVICIGASTGGTRALQTVLTELPGTCPGILIVQHMPRHFTEAFANRLNGLCAITVREARDGDAVLRGHALIAPGDRHLLLRRSGASYYAEIRDGPLVSRHRPSVNVLFRSAARNAGANAMGILMTGMGDDGAKGLLELRQEGAITIAQSEESCVVFGMPREAIRIDAASHIVPLDAIARSIVSGPSSHESAQEY